MKAKAKPKTKAKAKPSAKKKTAPKKKAGVKAKAKPKAPVKKSGSRSPEVKEVARDLAVLGLARLKQEGQLNVRQREQLRRAMAAAGEHLDWVSMAANVADPLEKATKEVTKLTQRGTKAMLKEIAEELTNKKTEMSRLEKAAKAIHKLADSSKTEYPAEFSYQHTARDVTVGLVTKTEELIFADSGEAEDAALLIEKKFDSWGKLREQMVTELKQKQKQFEELKGDTAAFVTYARGLLREVLTTLH